MASLKTSIRHDPREDAILVRVEGRLDLRTAAEMRACLLKCYVQCPAAIVVDMSRCRLGSSAALTVFPSVAKSQGSLPPVALVLWGSDEYRGDARARTALGPVSAYRTQGEAHAAVDAVRAMQQRVQIATPPTLVAPALARDAVDDACDRWQLEDIRTPALLIISELVTNAVRHGAGDILVEAVRRQDFLHLRVHDGSPEAPVATELPDAIRENGRGLAIVTQYATAWGYVVDPARTGKVVWATLRIRPLGDRSRAVLS